MNKNYNNTKIDINFNERFTFGGAKELQEGYRDALVKGLPFPILTVAEYLAADAEGFCWGRSYREAGYYTSISLWVSFASWMIMNILFVVVPRYGAYSMTMTGLIMLLSDVIYYWLLPTRPLRIKMESSTLIFEFGWCFWVILVAGFICFVVGFAISIIDLIYPHKFSTVMEMDYGTPFDRHTIIEDSNETKKKKVIPKLEEPSMSVVGLGGLLRRFSKRDREHHHHMHPGGEDNYTFELDVPKSPWRYPHLIFRTDSRKNKQVSFKQVNHREDINPMVNLRRVDSKDSSCSSLSSTHQNIGHSLSVPASVLNQRFRRTDSADSNNSSLASFGISILSRTNSRKNKSNNNSHIITPAQEKEDNDINIITRGRIFNSTIDATDSGSSRKSSNNDEVTIVVGHRKNSVTKAIRRNSSEQKPENGAW
uniref:Dual oxidase maturation factor 1like [Ceratitis capitata] n=1 Tax=Lepeophtheirus salmonis TaxID=72036 RepID=A0A0K2TDJ0_LEPSM